MITFIIGEKVDYSSHPIIGRVNQYQVDIKDDRIITPAYDAGLKRGDII